MSKKVGYKLRWIKQRYEKGNATQNDIEFLKQHAPEYLDKPKERVLEVVNDVPKQTTPNNSIGENRPNSEHYHKKGVEFFLKDANSNTLESPQDFIENPVNSIAEEEQKTEQKSMIKGATLLFLIDLVAPNIFSLLANKFMGMNVKAKDLKAGDELKDLEEIANEVAAKMTMGNLTPVEMLSLSVVLIYGAKIIELKENAE